VVSFGPQLFFPDPNDIGRPEVARANLGRPSHQRGGSFLNVVSDGGFVVWHRSMEIDGYVGLYGVIWGYIDIILSNILGPPKENIFISTLLSVSHVPVDPKFMYIAFF
jgi:hypothetical protein